MYRLEYLPAAESDLEEAEAYLDGFSRAAADRFSEAVEKQTALLLESPLIYPASRYDGSLRCMPLPYKYLCFYCVDEAAGLVRIYRILRGTRDIPNML